MRTIEICAHGHKWEVSFDGWYQGSFDSFPEACEAAVRLQTENELTELVVHGEVPPI